MESNDALIISKTDRGVTTVTLNQPARRNALSRELIGELTTAFQELGKDDATRVIVLTHAGPVFCAGADLKQSAAATDTGQLPAAALPALFLAMDDNPKPVVVATRGGVRGGGMGLIAAADITVSTDDVQLAFSEVKLGVVPAVIAPVVARRVNPAQMRRLFLTGETFSGLEAVDHGIIDIATSGEAFDGAIDTQVNRLLEGGPEAQSGIKKITRDPDLSTDLARAAETTARYFLSDEGKEGVKAFGDKRQPRWVP
ncbi:enoyl-CoA hydratase-related protein [Haloglycomyces albus]|uniref:enoyl-CoA hydratase-related protein n=1 Tax=Haloglycomyces albus TaxID=526067 RepID=UPI00046D6E11|nr:enoyl-CoA hydratase-related protein [Haloglycomyces albus]